MQNAEEQMVPLSAYQKLEAEMMELKQRLAWFERMMFSRKSERFVPDEESAGQLSLGFESEQTQEVEATVRQLIQAHERKVPKKER